MKKKGFTLIEMLGVIVIIGLILLAVLPSMSKLIHKNDNEELVNYYELVYEAAETYSTKLKSELGSSKYTGCAEVTLDELIGNGYVQKFNDKDITCTTGSENIKLRNDKGKLTVGFKLSCSEGGKEIFVTGNDDTDKCERYVLKSQDNLKTTIESSPNIRKTNANGEVYATGANPANYVWYSGKLWRVVSYNSLTEVVRAVTVNPITSIYYNSKNSSTYSGSDVDTWLNNEFLNTLKDYQKFILNNNWNATPNASPVTNPTSPDKVKKTKIGLISSFDYGKIQDWYGTGESWLLSEGTGGNSLYSSGGIETTSSTTMLGVRPVIAFNSDVMVYDGNGTINDPYIIDGSGNAVAKRGEYLTTRYSGEYVEIDGDNYRIISNESGRVKVIGTKKIGIYMYSDNHYDYSASHLRTMLEGTLTNEFNISVNGDYCMDTINSTSLAYQSPRCLNPTRINNNIRIGIPKIGDFFTSNIKGISENYWTLNPNTEKDATGNSYGATMNVISQTGRVTTETISNQSAAVIVLYLNDDVKIQSGSGTSDDPYQLDISYDR